MTTHFHWFPLTNKDFTTILLLAYLSYSHCCPQILDLVIFWVFINLNQEISYESCFAIGTFSAFAINYFFWLPNASAITKNPSFLFRSPFKR